MIYGLGCCRIVMPCFCNIDGIEKGDALLGSEEPGMNEPTSLSYCTYKEQNGHV